MRTTEETYAARKTRALIYRSSVFIFYFFARSSAMELNKTREIYARH